MRQTSPRIPPLARDAMTDDQKARVGNWSVMNFSSVTVNHPKFYGVLLPMIVKLIPETDLPPRDREILVLRTLALCNETYEAHHHVAISHKAGLTDAEIEIARTGGTGLSPFERTLVKAAEELHQDQCISDATWQDLAQRYSKTELMEVVALVGGYTLMAMVTKSYGIQLEDQATLDGFEKMRKYT